MKIKEQKIAYAIKEVESSTHKIQEIKLTLNRKEKPKIIITSSIDSYRELSKIWNNDLDLRERFVALYLNRNNKIIGYYTVSIGGVNGTVVDNKLIFSLALSLPASAIILAHNHPSGNLKPSSADINLTKNIKAAGKLLQIEILDHLIITSDGYMSFADEGLM